MAMAMDTLCFLKSGISGIVLPSVPITSARANSCKPHVSVVGCDNTPSTKSLFSRFPSFAYPNLKSFLWSRGGGGVENVGYNDLTMDDAVLVENGETTTEGQNGNSWVFKMLQVPSSSVWKREQEGSGIDEEVIVVKKVNDQNDYDDVANEEEECDVCVVDNEEGEEEVQFDRESFSRMLRRVSLPEARFYAQMSYLGTLAYTIPKIQPGILLKKYGLRFVTSSIERNKDLAAKDPASGATQEEENNKKDFLERTEEKNDGYKIRASAATYLHALTRSLLPSKYSNAEGLLDTGNNESVNNINMINTEVASLRATIDSVTANGEVKQSVADNLTSTTSSPCNWFVCDHDQSCTRYFVIQGSESFQSWQANLNFEPIQFEGLDVLVHKGIYEAAKGMYQQMLPEVLAHLKSKGSHSTFRFTGHSLGGSLALLINLMLLIRHEVPISSLLPVITFGSPSIMCGGDGLLEKLGLPRSHVQEITMHRDIVPRAFSCNYPNHVVKLLKAINANFRNLPCLNNQNILYAPMGEMLILQPDEKFSPSHHLLPSGSGLYLVSVPLSESNDTYKKLRAAKLVFLNSPHPLDILRDRSAYGSGGTIQRDHDMHSYLKSVRTVIRQELNKNRKARREQRRKMWWPTLVVPRGRTGDAGINVVGNSMVSVNMNFHGMPQFSGIIQSGTESLKRLRKIVASQPMDLFVVLFLPARLLLLGAYSLIRLR